MTSHDIDAIVTMLDRDDITPEPSDAKNYGKQYKITLLIEEF
jgi:hypothetical protein